MKKIICLFFALITMLMLSGTVFASTYDRKQIGPAAYDFQFKECTIDLASVDEIPNLITSTFDEMCIIIGDRNNDGKVNVRDATAIQKKLVSHGIETSREFLIADANCDGKFNIRDATAIQKYSANMLTETEIGKKICPTETVRIFFDPIGDEPDAIRFWAKEETIYLIYWIDNKDFERVTEEVWPGIPLEYCEDLGVYVAEVPVYANYFAILNTKTNTAVFPVPLKSDLVLKVTGKNVGY